MCAFFCHYKNLFFSKLFKSGFVMGSLFVVGISAWYLLKNKDIVKAKKSIVVGATFGLITSIFLIFTGDEAAHQVALTQPSKLAAMEGLYHGHERAGIVAIGQLNHHKEIGDDQDEFFWSIEIPQALSILGFHDPDAFVPGINELVYGDMDRHNIESASNKMEKGKVAIAALKAYKKAKKEGNTAEAEKALADFRANEKYFGYGYLKDAKDIIPPVALTFYSFHIMVGLGTWFLILFFFILYFTMVGKLEKKKLLLRAAVFSIPLGYIAGEMGWIVAEVGRQPWAIFEMLPVGMATSQISTTAVQTTFWLFSIIFTGLLIAEIRIMTTQIKNGMEGH
ncbi:MAG: cytochrome ubiquinol oxidase subunit I [Sulfurovum sp.]|nr:cytochrome ubiquinol oxidase subunit I [Sulfurovum sp.]